MDIRVSSVYKAYTIQPSRSVGRTEKSEKTSSERVDSVSLSAQAGEFQIARKAALSAPDIRESLVGRIQEMLDSGTYHVSSNDVAAGILSRF
ncbi:MAG: flagellar biosynthesis anti-sigma factor FlgM [Defluviitaleaceae bacterium]|nr:flagellar biosynthesis anti-sigma factor FlgM [Defluviitaleaceae bacterium]